MGYSSDDNFLILYRISGSRCMHATLLWPCATYRNLINFFVTNCRLIDFADSHLNGYATWKDEECSIREGWSRGSTLGFPSNGVEVEWREKYSFPLFHQLASSLQFHQGTHPIHSVAFPSHGLHVSRKFGRKVLNIKL